MNNICEFLCALCALRGLKELASQKKFTIDYSRFTSKIRINA